MAATYVRDSGTLTAAGVDYTTTYTWSTNPVANNFIFVASAVYESSYTGTIYAYDNKNNGYDRGGGNWVYRADASLGVAADYITATVHSVKVTTTGGTFTTTLNSASTGLYIGWSCIEFSGLTTNATYSSAQVDRTGTNSGNPDVDGSVTASAENVQATGLAICVIDASINDSDINLSTPSGYTQIGVYDDSLNLAGYESAYRIYSSLETSSASWSHDNHATDWGWTAAIATYKDTGGGPAGRTTKNTRSHPLGIAIGTARTVPLGL